MFFIVASLLVTIPSQATLWHVTDVLSGSDQGFGFSSFHAADDDTPMSDAIVANVSSASGTYDDVTGTVNFELIIQSAIDLSMDTLTLTGNLLFDGGGWLAADSVLDYSELDNFAAASSIGFSADNNQFGFLQDLDCGGCGGADGPNSFMPQGGGDSYYMSLWGADFYNTVFAGNYLGSLIGMDPRLALSPVSVPAAVWLFGTALIGLFGLPRRKAAT